MGLLEYQAMPSLRDVAHYEWLCTFTAAAGNSISSQLGSSYQGNRYNTEKAAVQPVHEVQNHSLPGSQSGRHVGTAL
jgi:hypothetical protein